MAFSSRFRVQLKFMVTARCLRHTDAHLIEADCCAIERYLQPVGNQMWIVSEDAFVILQIRDLMDGAEMKDETTGP